MGLTVKTPAAVIEATRKAGSAWLAAYREAEAEAPQDPGFAGDFERIDFVEGMTRSVIDLEGLYLLASTVRPQESVVEVGSFCGRSTVALACGAQRRERAVITVDTHAGDIFQLERLGTQPSSEPVLRFNLAFADVESAVEVLTMTSVEAASAYDDPRPIGLLFIDGWHTEEAVVADARAWSAHLAEDPIVVFDDWMMPEVMAGIRHAEDEGLLPPRLGRLARHLVFCSRNRVEAVLPRLRTLADLNKPPRQYLRERASQLVPALAHPVVGPDPIL